jgi:type II secretion system protein I
MNLRTVQRPAQGSGFTLIEVAVALAISAWVLGSALSLVKQYADERIRLREQFLGSQVAWNQLMETYQSFQGWQPQNRSDIAMNEGLQQQGGIDWHWQLDARPALGQNLLRYQADSSIGEQAGIKASLSMYLTDQRRQQARAPGGEQ